MLPSQRRNPSSKMNPQAQERTSTKGKKKNKRSNVPSAEGDFTLKAPA